MKIRRNITAFCIVLAVAILGGIVFALPALAAPDFTIEQYKVDIQVQDDNSYLVTEQITQDYFNPAHGMFRTIDLTPTTYRESEIDGEVVSRRHKVQVLDVEVDNTFQTSREDGKLYIRIGDADSYVTDLHTDTISYRYVVGDDRNPKYDEFYFGIIGPEWNMPIRNVSFRITMPHDFDAQHVGFSVGRAGASGYDPDLLTFDVKDRVISGSYQGALQPGEAMTVRVELPEGYYTSVQTVADTANRGMIAMLIVTAVGILLFIRFHNREKPIQTVELYPPENMTSADVGYIVDGVVENKDVLSLLIYWADQGYMEIHEGERKKDISFHKVKDLPADANEYEQVMFADLFDKREIVDLKGLENEFYSTVAVVKSRIDDKFKKPEHRVFEAGSSAIQKLMQVLAALPIMVAVFVKVYYQEGVLWSGLIGAGVVLAFSLVVSSVFKSIIARWKSEKKGVNVGRMIGWAIAMLIVSAFIWLFCWDVFGWKGTIAVIAHAVLIMMVPSMQKRTPKGLRLYGQILGLKHFIQSTELERLEMLVEEQPSYFYHILPYAYVLGLSDTWAKQFEGLAVPPPTWYHGYSGSSFTTIYFTSMLMSSMARTQRSMLSTPSSSGSGVSGGGGGFSGGGFSGGGFGGGGGGSW